MDTDEEGRRHEEQPKEGQHFQDVDLSLFVLSHTINPNTAVLVRMYLTMD